LKTRLQEKDIKRERSKAKIGEVANKPQEGGKREGPYDGEIKGEGKGRNEGDPSRSHVG